jgi:sensor domain CHASE-containing protein
VVAGLYLDGCLLSITTDQDTKGDAMSELQKAVDKLVELTNQLEVDSLESIKSLREIAKTWEIDPSSIDEFESHINATVKNLREFLGEANG